MTAPSLFLLLRRQRALRESMALPCSAPRGRVCAGLVAPTPPDLGAPPQPPGVCAGLVAPTPPDLGAPPQTPGDFRFTTKVTKGVPGLRPWTPGTKSPPFSRSLTHRAGLVSATEKDRFATLRWWANRSLFLPSFLQGKFFAVNPWLGRVLVARLGATFGGIRGIGEGGFWKRTGNGGDGRKLSPIMSRIRNNLFIKFTASLEFVSDFVSATNGLTTPFISHTETKNYYFY